jgi:polysaccharide pyruvyl transferase WcaK-like protein
LISSSPPRSLLLIADVGAVPFHVGDEAMLEANLEGLRRRVPSVQVTVIGRCAESVSERLGVPALAAPPVSSLTEARLPPEIAAAFDAADGVFLSGGGNLCSSWPELLRQRVLLLREARRRGLPVVVSGQTLGPDLTPAERAALAEVLAGSELVGLRELPSAALALQMGVPPDRLSYQPDDAFFFAGREPSAEVHPPEPFLAVTLDPSFAAASMRGCLGSLAAQLARIAAESGLHLVFLPHVGPLDGPGEVEGGAAAALADLLRAESAGCTLLPVTPPAETVWLTRRASLVVSSRYHPLVFATAAGIPCFGIHRDPYTRIKLQGALAHVGMEAWSLPAAVAEEGALLPALRRLWDGREAARTAMTGARAALEIQEERRWSRLVARLGGAPESGETPEAFGCPADRLAAAALGALALERQASDAETGRLGSIVRTLERSVDLAVDRSLSNMERLRGARRHTMQESARLTEEQWNEYTRDGFLHLGKVLEPEEVEALRQRADDLALGEVRNPQVQMQLDTGGAYEELPAAVHGFERGTVLYRKIQGLESDELFSRLVKHPLCLEVCARQYGRHAPISIFRAMVMNKPAGQGTILPWHQDGGHVWALDRDPLVTIWVALDPATRANGCMEVVPGTHQLGLLSLFGSTVAEEDVARHCPPERVLPLEVEPGHAVLLHNWLIHRSGINPSPVPRRAFTACYMDGRTQSTLTGNHFPLVAGSLPAEPYPFVRQMHDEMAELRQMSEESARYARSLEAARQADHQMHAEVEQLRRMYEDAERYAKSLEAARHADHQMREEAERYAKSLEAARQAERPMLDEVEQLRQMREESERYAKSLEAELRQARQPRSLRQSVRQLLKRV